MDSNRTEAVLAAMDDYLQEAPVVCWKCGTARGEPSVCGPCKKDGKYVAPPKGSVRQPWVD